MKSLSSFNIYPIKNKNSIDMKHRIHSLPQLPESSNFLSPVKRQNARLQYPQRGDPSYFDNSGKKVFTSKNQSIIDNYLKSCQTNNQFQYVRKRTRKPVQLQNSHVYPLIDLMPTQPRKVERAQDKTKSVEIMQRNKKILNKNNIKQIMNKDQKSSSHRQGPSDIVDKIFQKRSQNQIKQRSKANPKEPRNHIIVKDFRQKTDPSYQNPQMLANRLKFYSNFQPGMESSQKTQTLRNKYQTRDQLFPNSEVISHNYRYEYPSTQIYNSSTQIYNSNSYLRLFGSPENLYCELSKVRNQKSGNQQRVRRKQFTNQSNALRRANPSNLVTLSYI